MLSIFKKKNLAFFSLALCCLFISCHQNKPQKAKAAFYHWQSNANVSPAEYDFLKKNNCNRIYIRLFDVAWGNDGPIELATVAVDTLSLAVQEIVPVVFFTERTFKNLRADGVDSLADNVLALMRRYLPDLDNSEQVQEIQFDCDWAEYSKNEYFLFLKKIKEKAPARLRISSTIRLHQYKFPNETGVPPCDRGMLMLYNTGDIKDFQEKNSILTVEAAQKYLHGHKQAYPLPLDIALPVYDWLLVYREEKILKIIYPPNLSALQDLAYFEKINDKQWRVKAGVQFAAHYLHPDDQIKLERSEMATLLELSSDIKALMDKQQTEFVSFYHLDTLVLVPEKRLLTRVLLDTLLR